MPAMVAVFTNRPGKSSKAGVEVRWMPVSGINGARARKTTVYGFEIYSQDSDMDTMGYTDRN